jgi:hypothetical protein
MTREDDSCRNCGLAIRTGHLTYNWFHTDSGKVQCPIPPIPPVATPWRSHSTVQDWDLLEDRIDDVA